VLHRPLVFVSALTFGDYLLWNWSLSGNHAVLALASGLTLPPLAVICLWQLVLALGRLIAYATRRSLGSSPAKARPVVNRARRRRRPRRPLAATAHGPAARAATEDASSATASAGARAGKLAA
jgi:hypothetical protein